jgi:HAD superfamily hydrolase (TIGR01509 family)
MKLKIPAGPFRAFLFDCDGTIADSMPLHYLAWKQALGEWNSTIEEDLFYSWGGRPTREIIVRLNAMQGLNMPVEPVARRKEEIYLSLLPQLKPIHEVVEHIEQHFGRIPFAVVSGGRRSVVERSIAALGLLNKFETIIGADEYKNGKPAPDAYLVAAERLGVAPEECLVFEDTDLGIEAATAAGMASVKVPSYPERTRKG